MTMQMEWVPIADLFENPANPRTNESAVDPVADSLRRFGWQQPIVAKPSGEVIAGNTRLKAARKLGIESVPVVRFQGTELDALAYGIADNKTHEFSSWDEKALAELLKHLAAEDALDGVGFSQEEIDTLMAAGREDPREGLEDDGPGDPPEHPVSRTGDLWVLGDHRLLCGDSTKAGDVQRLLAGELAKLVATDPPYLVDYTGARPNDSGKDWTKDYREIDIKDAGAFFRSVFENVLSASGPLVRGLP